MDTADARQAPQAPISAYLVYVYLLALKAAMISLSGPLVGIVAVILNFAQKDADSLVALFVYVSIQFSAIMLIVLIPFAIVLDLVGARKHRINWSVLSAKVREIEWRDLWSPKKVWTLTEQNRGR